MRGHRAKREAALAAEAHCGKPLLLIINALRSQLAAKKQEWARERNEGRRKSIAKEISVIEGLLELRRGELNSAIAAAAAEKIAAE
jgi:hypothetical protein